MPKAEGDTTVAKSYKLGVRVISRYGRSDTATGLFSAADIEEYTNQMVADGWRLMGQPQFTGMEDHLDQQNAGFRVMFWWERGN